MNSGTRVIISFCVDSVSLEPWMDYCVLYCLIIPQSLSLLICFRKRRLLPKLTIRKMMTRQAMMKMTRQTKMKMTHQMMTPQRRYVIVDGKLIFVLCLISLLLGTNFAYSFVKLKSDSSFLVLQKSLKKSLRRGPQKPTPRRILRPARRQNS